MMKRGFEDNVSRVRPRVRLGQGPADDPGQLPDALSVIGELPLSPIEPSGPAADDAPAEPDRATSLQASRAKSEAAEVAQLAKELGAELLRASEVNARLRADLDSALASLRQAAQEAKDQDLDHERLLREMDGRAAALAQMQEDLQLLEAERDGAGAQVARLARELREEKSRAAAALARARAAAEDVERIQGELDRLAAESAAHAAERDRALAEVAAIEAERDSLASELFAARQAVDEAAQSRDALLEIHRALDEARARASLVQR